MGHTLSRLGKCICAFTPRTCLSVAPSMPEAGWMWIWRGCARIPSAGFAGRHIQNCPGVDGHIWHYDTDRLHFVDMDNEAPIMTPQREGRQPSEAARFEPYEGDIGVWRPERGAA